MAQSLRINNHRQHPEICVYLRTILQWRQNSGHLDQRGSSLLLRGYPDHQSIPSNSQSPRFTAFQ